MPDSTLDLDGFQRLLWGFAIDDEQQRHLLGALFAIDTRSFGDTWTEPAIRTWMDDTGLAAFTRIDLGPDRWILTGTRLP